MNAIIDHLPFDIFCIDVDYIRPRFACSYLITHEGKAAFIDCGTSHSSKLLLSALSECDLTPEDVDYIIPTHVHLDHAGGAGTLMAACKNATLVVHPRGARHLIDPGKLIESASQVYGATKFQTLYGDIIPIDKDRVSLAHQDTEINLKGRRLLIADTPGHARHHICIYDSLSKGWFTGDTFGLSYPDISTHAGRYILPTTTPTQFEPEAWEQSIKLLLREETQHLYLTHFGAVDDTLRLANKLNQDLKNYCKIARSVQNEADREEKLINKLSEFVLEDLQKEGCSLSEPDILTLLSGDIKLNAQGLDIWLNR